MILSLLKGYLPGEMHFPVFACVEDAEISSFKKRTEKGILHKSKYLLNWGEASAYHSIPVVKNWKK